VTDGRDGAPADAKDRGEYGDSPQTRSLRIAAEAGARLNQAIAEWVIWAKTEASAVTPRP
jgi:hypothetical protein